MPFIVWLLRMSHNVAVDAISARRATPAEEVFAFDYATCKEAPERARSLHAVLASLPEDQRLERLESAPLTAAAHLQAAG